MPFDFVPVPPKFIDLANACNINLNSEQFNVIGVCVDFLNPTRCQSGKRDYKITFTLHDPVWPYGIGLPFAFFHRELEQLPDIRDQGDVVILRNVKMNKHKGQLSGWSNSTSSWVVLPFAELEKIRSVQDLKDKARWQGRGCKPDGPWSNSLPRGQASLLNEAELRYAKWMAEQEDPSLWTQQQPRTRLEISNTMIENGGTAPARKGKFRTLDQLDLPCGKDYIFADLLGEVRKIFSPNDLTTELYVTDYTTNDGLRDYKWSNDDCGRDGDPFGYIEDKTSSEWPGPWGKMTILVTCWGRQASVATRIANVGNFVYLRNVQIKMDRNGSKLEGNCRDDRSYPEKDLIEVANSGDEKRKEVLYRKRAYEQKIEAEGISFLRVPNQAKKRRQRDEPTEQQNDEPKSKRTKARNRKNKKAKLEAEQRDKMAAATVARREHALLTANPHIRCNQYEGVSCKPIIDILDPDILNRTTAKGNAFRLPFQNCTYKSKVRVVDFFPDNIADFAAPRKVNQFDDLSDNEDLDENMNIDLSQVNEGEEVQWEWRFILLVEDARAQAGTDGRPTQMELLVAATDGDFLLNMDACNLRDKENQGELATLKEKLFHLWGDLQERKEELGTAAAEGFRVKPSARPFECLIKEYGAPVLHPKGQAKNHVVYDRRFRLFGTALAT
ncbi:uncharacterized protein Z519_11867 [Cladophialophora bantiana CBS 173.52]|uniref:Protection of telomeres protein 1 n=1 Tax=Cladophialophora bantiana (strain ATCC 10958 / CBS 173.52 / CDC B-1940 / NIH 8579) TaxID=1442370 RepID=A0A0D2H2P0_CLAB1|nr:uncharacterized protein Z519_11867 [Cladophialophora bantiana CBS 173.52]KIW87543.1 hypothetical protein Z519_11867 [Cladophialophora bantiana CBS 173.52]